MKNKLLKLTVVVCLLSIVLSLSVVAAGDYSSIYPYEAYVYNNDSEPVSVPLPYKTSKVYTGDSIGVGAMTDLNDIFYGEDKRIYLCDAGNNRVISVNEDFSDTKILSEFTINGTLSRLSEPSGVFVNEDTIYVADSANARIVLFDRNTLQVKSELLKPEISQLGEDYKYVPRKVAVDKAGRIYVIADGINQGLICLDENGKFMSFLGAPSVEPNFLEILERRFASKEKRKNMQSYVPTEYTSLSIDEYGFIYVASQTSQTMPVAKLNSEGENVMIKLRNDADYGDVIYEEEKKIHFCDVAVAPDGSYYAIDYEQGKVFAYTADGQMLYAFGASGSQKGTYYTARSIQFVGDRLLVADGVRGAITVYEPTLFDRNIKEAFKTYNKGEYEKSNEFWQNVYNQCSGYTPAIIGMAKNSMRQGNYSEAMKQLKSIKAYDDYADAFEEWRSDFLKESFPYIVAGIVILIIVFMIIKRLAGKYGWFNGIKNSDTAKKVAYGKYAMFHPFDGFWDIKHENKGNMRGALIILSAFAVLYALRAQFSGYIVTKTVSQEVNSLYSLALIIIPLGLYVISNWCFTTLMDGKGSLKDIFIATSYSLTPYVLIAPILFVCSHVLTDTEVVFYSYADSFCIVWVLALIFFSMMTIHDYSLSKAVLTTVLTLVGMCLIIFIVLLGVSVVQKVFVAFYNVYKELTFRTY